MENDTLQDQCEEGHRREDALKEELQRQKERLKSASESTVDSVSKIEGELQNAKEKLVALEKVAEEKLKLEKTFQDKFDHLEKDNEKLTKDMLKHMRRANELSETMQTVISTNIKSISV